MKASSDMGGRPADRLDLVVGVGEDASLVVERDLADVLQEERLLELAPLQLLRFPVPCPGVDLARGGRLARRPLLQQFLQGELLLADVLTQRAAQDLRVNSGNDR